MDRVNEILNSREYRILLNNIELLEKDRIYCKHNLEHFLNMARICYIINLERNLGFSKEIIYIIGLLHDIGRGEQYEKGTPHNEASYEIAKSFLDRMNFSFEEKELIKEGILGHRRIQKTSPMASLIYEGDKLSRECYNCKATLGCNWDDSKKNLEIKY
ncbi:HD domain-containing protein [Clostridium paridis]|uniref:HD domain-containing protein n=1 Tax=Clostridium paridis TaxID=2803863 RepID=A0A937FIX7_9CLOT|nr:HD domain-containing protein [Clostridium paridis]MBL4932316.1 HD domain-containing protein [Clostridium paridis]